MDRYADFDLRIEKMAPDRYRVRVSDLALTELGEAAAEFTSPFSPGELESLLGGAAGLSRDLGAVLPAPPRKALEEIGGRLFKAVFSGSVHHFWQTSLYQAKHHGIGLRLRLRLRDPELARWPWEYLYDPDQGFLVLSRWTPIVRYLELKERARTLEVGPPLRILVVIAAPVECAKLDTEREWGELKEALAGLEHKGQVVLDRLDHASLSALHRKVRQPYNILHFIGHGTFEAGHDEGVLLLEREDGRADPVSGKRLAAILSEQYALGLVVLNACSGAAGSVVDSFAGVAQSLVWGKIPAVIAMRSTVSDRAATVFARAFYETLARKLPLEEALCDARQALFADRHDLAWAAPVLYMRSPDGHVISSRRSRRIAGVAGAAAVVLGLLGVVGYVASSLVRLSSSGPSPPRVYSGMTPLATPLPKGSSEGCPPVEDLGIIFKRIDPGAFEMGSTREGKDARPPHRVTISHPFCMSAHEITQRQWGAVMGENPSAWQGDNLPVERVSWWDVQEFLKRLQSRDIRAHFRQPSEAQWEYAARGKSAARFSFGEAVDRLTLYGNCESRQGDDRYDGPAPVGSFAPNFWGLYDMAGNVSEWVADWYGPYPDGLIQDPSGPLKGEEKVRRGGSFEILAENCGSARRNRMKPDARKQDVGFRIVRDPIPTK